MFFLIFSSWALANGLTTHSWITTEAISLLPNGDLKDLLADPSLERYWRNGTIFPDGGYPQGDNYGEMAHWEPFQMAYLDWIKTHYQPPWTDEASQHIAFLLGMNSHGMADQSFDSMYMSRAWVYDASADWSLSMDTATDVIFSSLTGPQTVPDAWIPDSAFIPIFESQGHIVDLNTLENGQDLVRTAVTWVGTAGQTDELVDLYTPQFPWANSNLLSETISGAPPVEAQIVAEYWQVIWDRLHQEGIPNRLIRAFPSENDYAHPLSAADIESRISLVFAKGLDTNAIDDGAFSIQHSDGSFHPISFDVFYGMNSHIVHLLPIEDFQADSDYTILIAAGLPFIDGSELSSPIESPFTTRLPPEPEADPKDSDGRGCQSLPKELLSLWIMGLWTLRSRRVLECAEKPSRL